MVRPKIIFLTYYEPYNQIITGLVESYDVILLRYNKSHKNIYIKETKSIEVSYLSFSLPFLINIFLGLQLSIPIWIKNLKNILNTEMPDYIVAVDFYHWSFFQAISFVKRNKKTKILLLSETKTWPKNIISRLISRLFFFYFKKNKFFVSGVIVPTQQGFDFYKKNLPDVNIYLLPASVDIEHFTSNYHKQWLEGNVLRILINARYTTYKRHVDLFRAVAQIVKLGRRVKITCVSRDERGIEFVQNEAMRLGVGELVSFKKAIGFSELPGLYLGHDVLVLPSYNEAIGMVVPEAMACGIPTITSDTVGANVYVKDGVTGLVFKTAEVNELAGCINKCFEPGVLVNMGNEARKHILLFSKARMTKRFEIILNS